jgi:hypothetical protein
MVLKRHKKTKVRRGSRKQYGGVGYSPDVSRKNIAGRTEIVATSDCPALGPGDPGFAKALYGGGGKKSRKAKRYTKKRRSKTARRRDW